jgi:hypothetical protein
MSVKKGTAWWIGILVLSAMYAGTLAVAPDVLADVGGTIVLAVAFATVGYQGTQVADNWQRSKHYRSELDKGTQCGEEN